MALGQVGLIGRSGDRREACRLLRMVGAGAMLEKRRVSGEQDRHTLHARAATEGTGTVADA